jgi:hypothetical protein
VFVLGHIGRFEGRNVIDATHVHEATHPHEMYHHVLDVFVQHLFAIQQQASVTRVTHERDNSDSADLQIAQRQRID